MLNKVKTFWKMQNTLERKMFWSILLVITSVASLSIIITLIERSNTIAAPLCSVGCSLVCILIALIAVRTSLYNQCYLLICCVFSCFLLPLQFLFCGGITSGMPLYFTASLALIAYAPHSRLKVPAFGISLIVQAAIIAVTWQFPKWLVIQLDRDASYMDFTLVHLITGFTLFAIGSLSHKAYAAEREKTARLLAQQDYHSEHDSLTGVYNRRHILNYLEKVIWRNRDGYFLAMLDLDDFKRINREFGHNFGDEVIQTVAKLLQKNEDEVTGECVARFGCEKFIYVINAGSEVEAYAKVEAIRKAVRLLSYDKHPQVSLTISGGLVSCSCRSFADVRQMLVKVDSLLLIAKSQGKNQIRNMVE